MEVHYVLPTPSVMKLLSVAVRVLIAIHLIAENITKRVLVIQYNKMVLVRR